MNAIFTRRQREVLEFIARYIEERGYSPTVREIGKHLGRSSSATVYSHIRALVQKGYLIQPRRGVLLLTVYGKAVTRREGVRT